MKELEIYVKSMVLERMKEEGVALPDMNLSDVDLDRDYASGIESRQVLHFLPSLAQPLARVEISRLGSPLLGEDLTKILYVISHVKSI